MYLLGEPIFAHSRQGEDFLIPLSQASLCHDFLKEKLTPAEVLTEIRVEYLSIVRALKQMGVDFRIVFAHESLIDKPTLTCCVRLLDCRLAGFHPHTPVPCTAFPRDFATSLPKLLLLNPAMKVLIPEKDGHRVMATHIGEGGRMLFGKDTVIVCANNRLSYLELQEGAPALELIKESGLNIIRFPYVVAEKLNPEGQSLGYFPNAHLDRCTSLLVGADNGLHLIVDPGLITCKEDEAPVNCLDIQQTLELLNINLTTLGLTVHVPGDLTVPYALNLMQFPDKRVLMTSGSPEVENLIRLIVGDGNVSTTEVPVRFLPLWQYAGIRCLIGELPEFILKKLH